MKHAILLFLSPTKPPALYKDIEREDEPTRSSNESAIRWLIKHEFDGDANRIAHVFILASKMVSGSISKDDPRSHLEFFKERLNEYVPGVKETVYDYDESGSGDQNLISVAEMAGNIQRFAAEVGEEVTLHVDITSRKSKTFTTCFN